MNHLKNNIVGAEKVWVAFLVYFYELKPVIVGSVQLLTLLLGLVNEKLVKFANPIFFLRHRINRLIETRKKYCLKVNTLPVKETFANKSWRTSFLFQRNDCMQALLNCESEDFDRSLDHKNISLSTDLPLKMSLEVGNLYMSWNQRSCILNWDEIFLGNQKDPCTLCSNWLRFNEYSSHVMHTRTG